MIESAIADGVIIILFSIKRFLYRISEKYSFFIFDVIGTVLFVIQLIINIAIGIGSNNLNSDSTSSSFYLNVDGTDNI